MANPKMNFVDKIKSVFGVFFYRVDVEIYEPRANAFVVYKDRARRIEVDGIEKYHLLKNNETFTPPAFSELFVNKKGRNILKLFMPQTGQFVPIKFAAAAAELTVEDKEAQFWYTLDMKEASTIYENKNTWEKLAPFVFMGIMSTMILLQLIFFKQGIDSLGGALGSATGPIVSAVNLLRETITNAPPA